MNSGRLFDTIVAPITAAGRGAIAVVRVSGSEAFSVARSVFAGLPENVESHRAYFGRFSHGDDGLALVFLDGRGYTGEPSVEFSLHGSPASVSAFLGACEKAGARMAEPGEFTRRAFMNGLLDLTEAEAVRDSVEASTEAQFRAASRNREGALHRELDRIAYELGGVLAAVEASTDFGEEVGPVDQELALQRIDCCLDGIQKLLSTAVAGRVAREGAAVCIVGRPNAGKSSLLNAILGSDRAIVSEFAGTTRDTIEEVVEFGGLPLRLVDTAGLREAENDVEKIGIERSQAEIIAADVVWFVYDVAGGFGEEERDWFEKIERPKVLVANKSDLGSGPGTVVSAHHLTGLVDLAKATQKLLGDITVGDSGVINSRHKPLLERARDSTLQARETLTGDVPDDLAAVGLRDALVAIEEITGKNTTDDILDRIFRDFCIGK
ncbi:MAG: tRNA uridine-5-carboxymethylaminomethyl(34) synthesis GTPase MnmE [Armatimonadetes bacterium]|nr:tRNA uridine-5-carboxymethylaminomethyl(34) synthesis GTPase MnmE [Armatimonadota bacterium]